MAAMNASKKQKLFAVAGAAVMAVYDTLSASPTVLFPQDEDDDLYCPPSSSWEALHGGCDVHYLVQAGALAASGALKYEVETANLTADMGEIPEVEAADWTPDMEELSVVEPADLTADMEEIPGTPSRNWFHKHLLLVRKDENWMQHMQMTRQMFIGLVKRLEPTLQRERRWKHVASETKVGATVYRLVSAASLEEVGEKFDFDNEEAAQGVIEETAKAINSDLGHLIAWPTAEAMEKVIQGFRNSSSLPNCCGAIDGCDIGITGTNPNYKNKEGYCSVILQAVCDTKSKFLDVICGWPGRTHQTRVLRNSKFFERVNRGEVLSGPGVPINSGFLLRQYIVGDEEYPYLPWLITPYSNGPGVGPGLMYSHKCFNRQHEMARTHVTEGFDLLKSTFKLLGQPMEEDLDFLPQLIFSACILHNLLIDSRVVGFESVLDESNLPPDSAESEADHCEEDATTIRDELTEFIALST